MALTLEKMERGNKITLEKENGTPLVKILVGLGWDPNKYDGNDKFDLDASLFMLDKNGKVRSTDDFIFYNQPDDRDGSVHYGGDNRTGEGEGDDETIQIDLQKVPADIEKLAITVTIDKADVRMQNFGMIENAYIHIVDEETGEDIIDEQKGKKARYDLTEDFDTETAVVIAEIYRYNGKWKFGAVGSGYQGGLRALCNAYGVEID